MRSKKMSLAWTVILCLGLVMSPAVGLGADGQGGFCRKGES